MIVARVSDSVLRQAVCLAAHPEEDVVTQPTLWASALKSESVRLVVAEEESGIVSGVPTILLDRSLLSRWEAERRLDELPRPRVEYFTRRLEIMMARAPSTGTWVDFTLADLGRVAGRPLPFALRAFGRRVMEFPTRYQSLHSIADLCDASRGALKARFRRRGLSSPYTYLRWFRLLAVARTLSDADVSVARAAELRGFTSGGNLCRTIRQLSDLAPTELRSHSGRNRLLLTFAARHLSHDALLAWSDLEDLFVRRAA